jgi:hypothetical protein
MGHLLVIPSMLTTGASRFGKIIGPECESKIRLGDSAQSGLVLML